MIFYRPLIRKVRQNMTGSKPNMPLIPLILSDPNKAGDLDDGELVWGNGNPSLNPKTQFSRGGKPIPSGLPASKLYDKK